VIEFIIYTVAPCIIGLAFGWFVVGPLIGRLWEYLTK
jgi:hypothetical protein